MVLPDSYAEAGRRPSESVRNDFYYGGLNVCFKTKSEEIDLSFSNTNLSERNPEFRQTLEFRPFCGLSILSQLTDWEDFLGTFKVASDRHHLVHEIAESMCSSLAIKYWITDGCFIKASLNDHLILGGSIGLRLSPGTFVSASILQAPESYSAFNTQFGLGFDIEK
nr:unnamed protein product [Spirometra erinaceieuropaei]